MTETWPGGLCCNWNSFNQASFSLKISVSKARVLLSQQSCSKATQVVFVLFCCFLFFEQKHLCGFYGSWQKIKGNGHEFFRPTQARQALPAHGDEAHGALCPGSWEAGNKGERGIMGSEGPHSYHVLRLLSCPRTALEILPLTTSNSKGRTFSTSGTVSPTQRGTPCLPGPCFRNNF